MPEPWGNPVTMSAFVDANHAGNVVTRRSHSGILIYVQNAPIVWLLKWQNTVEGSTFGSEMVALRICRDLIVGLRYKLRMFGVAIDGPANVLCDNHGVVKNVSILESTLLKWHNAINYHIIWESVAAKIIRVGKEDSETNNADMLTKSVTAERWLDLCWSIMVWFMGISYLENFLTWQYWLIGWWMIWQYIWYGAWEYLYRWFWYYRRRFTEFLDNIMFYRDLH
jgi:hypothetical protein